MMSTARAKIQAARTALVLDQPFWGVLALRLQIIADQPGVPKAATDGTHLFYDSRYVESLSHDEVLGLLAEEIMHCAMGHMWRRDGRDMERWNVACDYALACILKDAAFDIGDMIHDQQYHGRSAEWIYQRLPQPQSGNSGRQQKGRGKQPGSGQPGGQLGTGKSGQPSNQNQGTQSGGGRVQVLDPPASASADVLTEADWQQAVQQAAVAAKARGNLPASLDRFAKSVAESRVDWRSVLRRFVQQVAKEDYRWSRPNTRHLVRGLYLPSLRSEAMGPIAVAVDTSGSIDQATLDQFFAEMNAVASEMRPSRIVVIYCDVAVQRIDEFERDDIIEARPKGGGGTSHVPVMNTVDAMDEPPVCVICLTDLQTKHRQEPPAMPVLWAATCVREVPYGDLVSLENV